jgi:hypothetical protein
METKHDPNLTLLVQYRPAQFSYTLYSIVTLSVLWHSHTVGNMISDHVGTNIGYHNQFY